MHMDRCTTCEGLSERCKIATPEEYRDVVRQLIDMVDRQSLRLVQADCPLEDILRPLGLGIFFTMASSVKHADRDSYFGLTHIMGTPSGNPRVHRYQAEKVPSR